MKNYQLNAFELAQIAALDSAVDTMYYPAEAAQLHGLLRKAAASAILTEADCYELVRLLPRVISAPAGRVKECLQGQTSIDLENESGQSARATESNHRRNISLAQQIAAQHFLSTIMQNRAEKPSIPRRLKHKRRN